ncbi:hypothetical protein JTB14_030759 [Gonioctena quinquepunctata]|nr:hypothetical protein JTB14_030759 [Gonioctena quinquepunctata]
MIPKHQKKKGSHQKVHQNIEPEESEQEEEMILDDSDDDIKEEMREVEALESCMNEISKPLNEVTENDWVLVCLSGKKSKRYYVGQITRAAN